MKPYHQLMESGVLTEKTISASLTQDEASELEYRAGVAELRDKLRASSPTGGETAAAPLYSTNSGAVLHASALAPPPVFNFRAPQLELPLFSDNSQNDFAFNEFKLSFNNALQTTSTMTSSQKFIFLRSLLRARALSLLQQCDCTEDGDLFSTAWELLEKEFLR